MSLDQFVAKDETSASSSTPGSSTLAFFDELRQFHKEQPALAVAADLTLAAGALLTLTPGGQRVGSMLVDQATHAGRNLMERGERLAADLIGPPPELALEGIGGSAERAFRHEVSQPVERGAMTHLSVASGDGSSESGASKLLMRLAENFANSAADLNFKLSDLYNGINDGKPFEVIRQESMRATRLSLDFEDAGARSLLGGNKPEEVAKVREKVFAINNHLQDKDKDAKEVLPKISDLINEVWGVALK